jgi:hypothetical protein
MRFIKITLLLLAMLLLGACGRSNISWNEEVLLQSGEKIIVHRTVKTKAFGEIGGAGGWENMGMTLEIQAPQRPDNPPLWTDSFTPLVFDRDPKTQQWFMVATFDTCQKWEALGKPKLPYTEYRVQNGQWVQQALSPELIGREGNMLTSIHSGGEKDLTIEEKAKRMSDMAIVKKAKRVVDKWSTGC